MADPAVNPVDIRRDRNDRRSDDMVTWLVSACLIVGTLVCAGRVLSPSVVERLLRQSAQALSCEDYQVAEQFALSAIAVDPQSDLGWALAGTATAKLKRSSDAVELFSRVRETAPIDVRIATIEGLAERQILLGHAADAERNLRHLLTLDPDHSWGNWRLAYLLQVEGRCWESIPHLLYSMAHRATGADELILLGTPERVFIRDDHFVDECQSAHPEDPLPLLGQARNALLRANREHARELLERIAAERPDSLEAQARLGRLRLEVEGPDVMARWQAQLPEGADSHPEIWITRGYWMKHLRRDRDALACFAAALRLFPDHVGATYQLSQLLASAGDSKSAEKFATRSTRLSKLEYVIDELRTAPQYERIREAYDFLISLGRTAEALGWCRVMLMYQPQCDWANAAVRRFRCSLSQKPPDPLSEVSASLLTPPKFPLPQASESHGSLSPSLNNSGSIAFRDDAAACGLAFQYVNGTTQSLGLEHMLQATGAGCGVIDYDSDGWPDLYFCQSGVWPLDAQQNPHRDRLFRNTCADKFVDTTEHAGLGDGEFSQGLAVGDFDNDGFADLFIGNVGHNRLYHNNGDGTFTDVTDIAHVAGGVNWTTSAAFADLNGDTLPDLYVVHYLVLDEVLKRVCKFDGRPMGCAPTMFTGDEDLLYINQGDGTFVDATATSGIIAKDGKGLGIVVADFQNRGQLDVYVGNDTVPSFLFVNAMSNRGGPPLFREEGMLRGVALNEAGVAQASMGIGCDDADGDGQLDLYVTTFYADYNTLFIQQSDQTFADSTRRAALHVPTFNMLGFGTQFIDADLDGWPDLVVANGHVDRTFSTGVPDAMPPQMFRNLGGARYIEMPASDLGPYFQRLLLGRSMSRLDWNADGREDLCVVHLDAPAVLLTNQSPEAGHWAALQLRGTKSDRDAVGARVRLTAGGRTWLRQITAGDGYMAANERRLVYGLGQNSKIDEVEIIWPSGQREFYDDVRIERDLIAIEGSHRLIELVR